MNKVIILGNLGNDPELKYTSGGTAVCNFNVATSEKWTDRDGSTKERTEWHRVVVWGKSAENCEKYLKKGSKALIEGSLQTRDWQDKDGNKRYTTEVKAQSVQFIGTSSTGGNGRDYAGPSSDVPDQSFNGDDVPF